MTFGEYSESAHVFSRLSEFENPDLALGERSVAETHEVFFEGGINRAGLLLGFSAETGDETRDEIAKEFGDVLWFINEHAVRNDLKLEDIALQALQRKTGLSKLVEPSDLSIRFFDDFTKIIGHKYSVTNYKMKFGLPKNKQHLADITVSESPGYVLQRLFARLNRAIHPPLREVNGPPGNADFDSEELIEASNGDTLLAMSWIGQTMLNTTLENIAALNLEKLTRREAAGTLLSGKDVDRSF